MSVSSSSSSSSERRLVRVDNGASDSKSPALLNDWVLRLEQQYHSKPELMEMWSELITYSVQSLTRAEWWNDAAGSPELVEACKDSWFTVFQDHAFQFVDTTNRLSACDMAFVAYCHALALVDENVSLWGKHIMSQPDQDREHILLDLQKHIKSLLVTPTGMDQVPLWLSRMAAIVVFGPTKRRESDLPMESDAARLLDRARTLTPALYGASVDRGGSEMGRVDRPSTDDVATLAQRMKHLKVAKSATPVVNPFEKKIAEDDEDLDNEVTLTNSVQNKLDTELAHFDLYMWVADCSRYMFWYELRKHFLAFHGNRICQPTDRCIRMTEYTRKRLYLRLKERADSTVVNKTIMEATDLNFYLNTPTGGLDHHLRDSPGTRQGQLLGTICTMENGREKQKKIAETFPIEARDAFPRTFEEYQKLPRTPALEAWMWVLWDREMEAFDERWLRDWWIKMEDLNDRMEDDYPHDTNLHMWRPSRVCTRQPLVIHLHDRYYIQVVRAEFQDKVQPPEDDSDWNVRFADQAFELIEVQTALDAILCWCDLMVSRFNETMNAGVRRLLHSLILHPTQELRIQREDNDNEKEAALLQQLLTEF